MNNPRSVENLVAAIFRPALLAIFIGGCSSQQKVERDAMVSNANDCLVRETIAIAPQPIDLDTATFAVLARCDYPSVLERSLAAQYPGYRDYIRQSMQRQYAGIVASVRRGIESQRTQMIDRKTP